MTIVPVGQCQVQIAVGSVDGEPTVYLEEQSVSASGRTTRGARVFVPTTHVSPLISALMECQDAIEAGRLGGRTQGRADRLACRQGPTHASPSAIGDDHPARQPRGVLRGGALMRNQRETHRWKLFCLRRRTRHGLRRSRARTELSDFQTFGPPFQALLRRYET